MGSENSKSGEDQEGKRNQTKREVGQRLYTEDDIQRALVHQKRMFEAKQSQMPTSSGIYPNLPTQNLNTVTRPSNPFHYGITPSAPEEEVVFPPSNSTALGQTYQQNRTARPPTPVPRSSKPTSAGTSHVTSSSAGTSYVTSSAGPSQGTLTSVRPSHVAPSPVRPLQGTLSSIRPSHVAPPPVRPLQGTLASVRPSHDAPTSVGLLQGTLSSVRSSHVAPSPVRPSRETLSSIRSSHVVPSPGRPSQETVSLVRSSHVTPSSAGPSHVTVSPAGPSHVTVSPAGPSHVTVSPAGPSHVTLSPAGPSQATPTFAGPYKGNQKKRQTQRTRSRSRVNQNTRELSGTVNCVTCNGQLSLHIYQCSNGHSSCDGCRFKMARCGNCTELITDMRNITLESTLAEMTISSEERIKCSNAKDGCCLHFKRDELQNHLKECPFNIISCPMMEFSGDCRWKGMIKQLATHFNDAHPLHCEADVNKETHMIIMEVDYKVIHLVNIGFHKFLVHIRLDTSLNNIYMTTQYLGTNFSASKWTYEWHVYNKREPRRKYEYIDVCKSNATPVSEIVNNNDCAVININYAKTFLDSGKLTFKFYIKKQFDKKRNIDTNSN